MDGRSRRIDRIGSNLLDAAEAVWRGVSRSAHAGVDSAAMERGADCVEAVGGSRGDSRRALCERVRNEAANGEVVTVAAADPLNLAGIVVPGEKVAANSRGYVSFRDGVVIEEERREWEPMANAG